MQIYDFDRDYKDIGVARFTTKYFVVRNCLPNAKSDMLLSAWNPPPEWGKYVFLTCLFTVLVYFPYYILDIMIWSCAFFKSSQKLSFHIVLRDILSMILIGPYVTLKSDILPVEASSFPRILLAKCTLFCIFILNS